MLVFGFGINTDVDHIAFAVLDRDQTTDSRAYLEAFTGSAYFTERAPLADTAQLERRMASGEVQLAIDIPAGFGRSLRRGLLGGGFPEVGVWIDGAMPFHAESVRGYVQGVHARFLARLAASGRAGSPALPATIELRFRYNQDFDSAKAMVPGTLSMLLALIPAILMALAVVREKELGSITNLYVTPVRRIEFILGKQLPHVGLPCWTSRSSRQWRVHLRRQAERQPGGIDAGAPLYVTATTAYGLRSRALPERVAAMVGTAIPHGSAGDAVLRHADAGLHAVRLSAADGTAVPDDLLSADQPRHAFPSRWALPNSAPAVRSRCSSRR
jgi:ribosome-dependent ATPase